MEMKSETVAEQILSIRDGPWKTKDDVYNDMMSQNYKEIKQKK